MLVLKYSLTLADHYNFNYYRYWQSPEAKKGRLKLYFRFIILVILGFALFHWLIGNSVTVVDIVIYSAVIIATSLLLPEFYKAQIKKQVKKLLADPKNKNYTSLTELIISEQGVLSKDEFSESKYEWKAFIKQEETKEYYYLFLSGILIVTIPKRILTSSEKEQLDLYLSRYISFEAAFTSRLENA